MTQTVIHQKKTTDFIDFLSPVYRHHDREILMKFNNLRRKNVATIPTLNDIDQ